jgi:hypothetical protein
LRRVPLGSLGSLADPSAPKDASFHESHAFEALLSPSPLLPLSTTLRRGSLRPVGSASEPRKSKVFHLACGPLRGSEEPLGGALPTFPPSVSQTAGTGPTYVPEDTWLVGAPALSSRECRSHCNLSQRLKESPLEITIDLRTPIRELQTPKSTNSRCRRTSHWSLSLFQTPQDSTLLFSDDFSCLERLDPFSPPNISQALNWLHSEPRSYGVFLPYDVSRRGQRPTLGLPHLAALRLQVFPTS